MQSHWQGTERHKRVKFAKKESVLTKNLIPVIERTLRESPTLEQFFVTRVTLSKEGGCVNIFVGVMANSTVSGAAMQTLKQYQAPIRKVVADVLCSKWTPEVSIRFDENRKRTIRTDELLNAVAIRESDQSALSLDETIKQLAMQNSHK